jgi:hypothetical protein
VEAARIDHHHHVPRHGVDDMSYEIDGRSRVRAVAVYAAVIAVAIVIGMLVRSGVITDHILW